MDENCFMNKKNDYANKGFSYQTQDNRAASPMYSMRTAPPAGMDIIAPSGTVPATFNNRASATPPVSVGAGGAMPPVSDAPAAFPATFPPARNQQRVPGTQNGAVTGQALPSIVPTTLQSPDFMAGLLNTFIGSRVLVEFLIGTNAPMIDVSGTLLQVGANYIIIQPVETDDLMICDLFSIKFITIYR